MHDAPDITLLKRLCAGDHAASEALWVRHAGRLIAVAAMVTGERLASASLAHDIVQDAWIKLLTLEAGTIEGIRDVHTWLTTLVRRTALNTIRGESRHAAHIRESGVKAASCARPMLADADPEMTAVIESLDEPLREAIVLKHVAELTFDQMALVLDQPRTTIASRYQAALKQLRERLAHAATSAGVHP